MSTVERAWGDRLQRCVSVLVGRPTIWLVVIAAMFTWPIARSLHVERDLPRQHRPVLGLVRDFVLIDGNGSELDAGELRGRVWVASFAAAVCAPTCGPTERMLTAVAELRHRTRNLGDAMRLVTFPTDPDRATAARLRELSAAHRSSRGTWRFISGPPATVREVLHDFHVTEGKTPTRVALVDGNMHIRGNYDLTDEAALGSLLHDVSLLLAPDGQHGDP